MRNIFKTISYIGLFIFVLSIFGCGNKSEVHLTAKRGDIDGMKQYLASGGDINAITEKRWPSGYNPRFTPLHFAVMDSKLEMVRFLLSRGANIEAVGKFGTPLQLAVNLAETDIIKLLIKSGADIQRAKPRGSTLLHLTIASKGLSSSQIKRTGKDERRMSAVKVLLESGLGVNVTDKHGRTPLMLAANREYVKTAEYLIKAGADVNHQDKKGNSALFTIGGMRFSKKGSPNQLEVFKLLVNAGADMTHTNKNGDTVAYTTCNSDIIEMLASRGFDFNRKNKRGDSPIHAIAGYCDVSVIEKVVKLGGSLDNQNNYGTTPMHTVVYKDARKNSLNKKRLVDLLSKMTDMKVKDSDGRNLLHLFLMSTTAVNNIWIGETLVQRGFDVNAKDKYGCTAADIAVRSKGLVSFVNKHGGNVKYKKGSPNCSTQIIIRK